MRKSAWIFIATAVSFSTIFAIVFVFDEAGPRPSLPAALAEPESAIATASASDDPQVVVLRNPGLEGWQPEFAGAKGRWRTQPAAGYTELALPTGFFTAVYNRLEKPRKTAGRVRRGTNLSVRRADTSITCYDNGKRGVWYEVAGGGFICSTSGFEFVRQAKPLSPPQQNPAVNAFIPFRYARVMQEGAARLSRRPTPAQWEGLRSIGGQKDDPSGLLIERMIGDFFLSLDTEVEIGGVTFMRTVKNEFVESSALKVKPPPAMRGERLRAGGPSLPLAFIWGEDTTEVLCADGAAPCGLAEKHARFAPQGTKTVNGARYYVGPNGVLVPASSVRLVESRKRPGGVGPDDRWIHIDLARQTLVAYEGETPVYATLVSSGKEGHDTPTGLYRMQRKYLSKRMRAVDPKEGLYHIEDIPYVMYYYGAYAIHGAFWHDVFGQTRSHGCTNLAPPDARWIYHWSKPPVPSAWHAVENIEKGLPIYFSNNPSDEAT